MNPKLLAAVSILVIIGSLVWIFHTQHRPPLKPDPLQYEALGQAAAAETLRLFPGPGTVVVLMGTPEQKSSIAAPQMAALQRAFQQQRPGLTVIGPVTGALDWTPAFGPGPWLAKASYFAVLQKYPQADVIVSFLGAPGLADSDLARLPARRPKLLVLAMPAPLLWKLIDEKVVDAALVRQFLPAGETKEPTTPREWFDKYYKVASSG